MHALPQKLPFPLNVHVSPTSFYARISVMHARMHVYVHFCMAQQARPHTYLHTLPFPLWLQLCIKRSCHLDAFRSAVTIYFIGPCFLVNSFLRLSSYLLFPSILYEAQQKKIGAFKKVVAVLSVVFFLLIFQEQRTYIYRFMCVQKGKGMEKETGKWASTQYD